LVNFSDAGGKFEATKADARAYGNPGVAVRLIGELKRCGKNPVFADDARDLFAETHQGSSDGRAAAAAAEPGMDESGQLHGFAKIIGQTDTVARLMAFTDLYWSKGNPIGPFCWWAEKE
jgi:hypothetical protein